MRDIRKLLNSLYEAKVQLRVKGVIRSERFTGELGEWLAECAYGGTRAKATTQKGWDVTVPTTSGSDLLQVRSHAKGKTNNARRTEIKPDSIDLFDRLIIIVLSDDYFIKEWYDIPRDALRTLLTQSGKSWVIYWDEAKAHKKALDELPYNKQVQDFNKRAKG
jgi:hypothetical protein